MDWYYYVCGFSALIFWAGFSILAYFDFVQEDTDPIIAALSLPMVIIVALVVVLVLVIFLILLPLWLLGKGVKKLFRMGKEDKSREAKFEEIFGKSPDDIGSEEVGNHLVRLSLKCNVREDQKAYRNAYDLAVVFGFVRHDDDAY